MYRRGQAPPRHAGVPICGGCGVVAPSEHAGCALCREPFPHPRVAAPEEGGPYWVAVRCSFQCRSCQFLSPLDGLDVDGSVECAQCGMHQRFDVEAWRQALAFAHGVGDLAYPPPEGRHPHPGIWIGHHNPHVVIGYDQHFAEHRQSSTATVDGVTVHRSLYIQASPGYPVCRRCKVPLEVTVEGEVATRCKSCGDTARYRMDPRASQFGSMLRGVVSNPERSDKPRARLETVAGGPVVLRCADCGGNLPAAKERVVSCPYCSAACIIPQRAIARDPSEPIEPDIWWLAFEGPSATRAHLMQSQVLGKDALKKLTGGIETYLEEAPKEPVPNTKQWMLTLLLPTLAMAVGAAVAAILGVF